ncbi:hypothetical protein HID58_055381 [Brassica napus]|uniref:Uncharacterized protein n=1 Tax=Brassica napus TaxID=3708 RepID=A0ABQ8AK47_BRANA|nr:hypothetical protein HID58_055381 [Brassica napus]
MKSLIKIGLSHLGAPELMTLILLGRWPFSYHCLCPRVSSLCFPFSRAWNRDACQMRERSGGGGGMRRRRRFLTEGEVLMGRGRDEGSGGAWSSLTFSTTLWSPLTRNRTRSRRRLLSTLEHHRRDVVIVEDDDKNAAGKGRNLQVLRDIGNVVRRNHPKNNDPAKRALMCTTR